MKEDAEQVRQSSEQKRPAQTSNRILHHKHSWEEFIEDDIELDKSVGEEFIELDKSVGGHPLINRGAPRRM